MIGEPAVGIAVEGLSSDGWRGYHKLSRLPVKGNNNDDVHGQGSDGGFGTGKYQRMKSCCIACCVNARER